MSVENSVRMSDNLFGFEQKVVGSETDNKWILEEIIRDDTEISESRSFRLSEIIIWSSLRRIWRNTW